MNEEKKLESKHVLCINWYILTEIWRDTYREIWTKRGENEYRERWGSIPVDKKGGKFRLDSKVPVLIEKDGKKEYMLKDFYDLFDIRHSDYTNIMHGKYASICYPNVTPYEETKIRKFTNTTKLPSYIFNGKECLIPLTNENREKLIDFADARFQSVDKYGYREESAKIKPLIKKYALLSDMITARSFVDKETEIIKIDPITQSMENILALHYSDLMKTDLPLLKRYIDVLRQHTERAKACLIHRKNIR